MQHRIDISSLEEFQYSAMLVSSLEQCKRIISTTVIRGREMINEYHISKYLSGFDESTIQYYEVTNDLGKAIRIYNAL